MANLKQTDYLFSTARVRSVERNLLTKERIEKMIDAKTADEALKVLAECEYGETGVEIASAADFEILLSSEHRKVYEFIRSIAPKPEMFDLFLYVYDYHNLKSLLKAEYLQTDPSFMLMETGTIPVSKLKVMIRERNYVSMTEDMRSAVIEVIESFSRTNDPQIIDLLFDKACFSDMLKAAKQTDNKFIIGYVSTLIDVVNLKSFVRIKKMNKSWDFLGHVFIAGGAIDERMFINNYDEPLDQFAEKLAAFGFSEVLAQGAEGLKNTGMFTEFEKLCDNILIEYVKNSKYVAYGIEPLVGYLVAKENEIKTARIIMAGKLAGLPSEQIKERLREAYV